MSEARTKAVEQALPNMPYDCRRYALKHGTHQLGVLLAKVGAIKQTPQHEDTNVT